MVFTFNFLLPLVSAAGGVVLQGALTADSSQEAETASCFLPQSGSGPAQLPSSSPHSGLSPTALILKYFWPLGGQREGKGRAVCALGRCPLEVQNSEPHLQSCLQKAANVTGTRTDIGPHGSDPPEKAISMFRERNISNRAHHNWIIHLIDLPWIV